MSLLRKAPRLAAGLALALCALGARAAPPASEPGDMTLGRRDAPVEVIEYASVGCPHCAAWANTVFPAFRQRFIDTGEARLVVRIMLTGEPTLATAGFMLTRCAGPSKYFEVMDEIYRRQASMFEQGAPPQKVLEEIAQSVGIGPAALRACLTSKAGLDAVNELNQRHLDEDKVELTPTFFVGGRRFEGDVTVDELAEAIHAARGGG